MMSWSSVDRILTLAGILNFFMPLSFAQIDPNCDYYQNMVMGQEYYIYNPGYPSNYPSGTPVSCRWLAESPAGTQIVLSCSDIKLPPSTNCANDRLAVSLTGQGNFNDAHNYCGNGKITLVTQSNSLAIGLFAPYSTSGGRFLCSLTSIQNGPPTTTTAKPTTCDCGWRHLTRIVGGHETGVNEFPSMSALIDVPNRDLFCGASIISDTYALTAAHCLLNRQINDVGLLVGDHNITSGSDTNAANLLALSRFIVHPKYDSTTQQNDIAVVRTAQRIVFSTRVGPICLPFRYTSYDFLGQVVTALGWGTTDFSGPKSDTLQGVDLGVVSNQECAQALPDDYITLNQLCTYAPKKDPCLADSGGPILWQDSSSRRLQLVAIISFGLACGTPKPAVNTRVTSYLTWVLSVTSDANYCIK